VVEVLRLDVVDEGLEGGGGWRGFRHGWDRS
jgi:hypothetical protein